jgi:carbon-monoxide dehydrogenase small subunit
MTIKFILNGDDVTLDSGEDVRLVDILRNNFGLTGTKAGCLSGICGVCFVLFNGKAVPSCIIPAFNARGSEIITIEGFVQTNEYQDIAAGFARERVEFCGFCDAGRIFATEALLEKKPRPSREEILEAFSGIRCRCAEPESLVAGVNAAAEFRQRRLYGRG